MSDDVSSFGVWLGVQLQERRISQRKLAHLSGVNHATISRLISGKEPSLKTATWIARALREPIFMSGPYALPNPVARVGMALRADTLLSDDDVDRLMRAYLTARFKRSEAQEERA